MKIIFRDFDIIEDIEKLESSMLVIENKEYFYKLFQDIQNDYSETGFIQIIDDKNRLLKLSDHIDVCLSLFSLDVNNKRNINAMLKQIKAICSKNLFNAKEEINDILEKTFSEISIEYSLELLSDIDISQDDILKMINISIEDSGEKLINRIMTYIKVTNELRSIDIFVFNSLFSLLTEDEMQLLLHDCNLLGVRVIDYEHQSPLKHPFIIKKVLDNDCCLLE